MTTSKSKKTTTKVNTLEDFDIYKMNMTEQEYKAIPQKDKFNRILTGKVYFAKIQEPDYKSQEKFSTAKNKAPLRYSLKLVPDDPQLAASYGHVFKEADEHIPYPHITLYTKVKEGKTPEEVKPIITDSENNEFNGLVGNESRAAVKYLTYWHPLASKHGLGTYMTKIKVTDLVPYENPEDEIFGTSSKAGAKATHGDEFDNAGDEEDFDDDIENLFNQDSDANVQ